MTKPQTALERARELYVASFPDAYESWKRAILAGDDDNDDWLRGALAALTSAQADRDAVLEEAAQVADGFVTEDTYSCCAGSIDMLAAAIRAMKTGGSDES